MFIPNTTCDLYSRGAAADNFGRHIFAPKTKARCAVIDMAVIVQKSSVRADTSGSRGQVDETQGDAKFLFTKHQAIKLGDIVFKDGFGWLEVTQIYPRIDLLGKTDHLQVIFRKAEPVA